MTAGRSAQSAFVADAALVSGYAAWKFAQMLGPLVARSDVERRADLEEALAALQGAGDGWRRRVRRSAEASEVAEAAAGARSSSCASVMTAADVAEVLEVSDRQVRNLAGRLGGVKRRGSWVFERAEVLAYREGRSA